MIRFKMLCTLAAVTLAGSLAHGSLMDNLEVYWAFDGNLNDSHNNAYNLTDQGTIGYNGSANILGQAASFDGDDKLFANAFVTEMGVSAASTIQCWVKTTDQGGSIMSKDTTGSGWNGSESAYYFGDGDRGGAGTRFSAVRNGGQWLHTDDSVSLTDDSWHHIVYINDHGSDTVYIDGTLVGMNQTGFNNSDNASSKIYLGWTSVHDGSNQYSGLMDEMAIWSRALSSDEAAELYNSGDGLAYSAIPEPATLGLLGIFGLVYLLRRKLNS